MFTFEFLCMWQTVNTRSLSYLLQFKIFQNATSNFPSTSRFSIVRQNSRFGCRILAATSIWIWIPPVIRVMEPRFDSWILVNCCFRRNIYTTKLYGRLFVLNFIADFFSSGDLAFNFFINRSNWFGSSEFSNKKGAIPFEKELTEWRLGSRKSVTGMCFSIAISITVDSLYNVNLKLLLFHVRWMHFENPHNWFRLVFIQHEAFKQSHTNKLPGF